MSGTESTEDRVIRRAEQLRQVMEQSGRQMVRFTDQLLREARELQAAVRDREKGAGREPGD
jgi:hypothetical protein